MGITTLERVRGSYDVVIMGAGIVGLSTALFLNRLGLTPLLVERLPSPVSLTSRRSGEGVRAQWERPHNIAISLESISFYRRFGDEIGRPRDAGYRPCGYLYASCTQAGARQLQERVSRQHDAGLSDVEFIAAEDLRRRFPLLNPDVQAGAFRQNDGTVEIDAIIAGYMESVEADLLLNAEVVDYSDAGSGVEIRLADGTGISAGALVICNGARLALTARRHNWALPVRTARSTILRLKSPAVPAFHPATIDIDIGSFWRPDLGGARLTASFRGMLFVPDGTDDPAPDRDYLSHALATVSPLVPSWREIARTIEDSHIRTGTFAATGDGAPVIGKVPETRNIFVNGGYGGHGVMMSPGGARLLAATVAGDLTDNPFDPVRFSGSTSPAPEPMTIHLPNTEKGFR